MLSLRNDVTGLLVLQHDCVQSELYDPRYFEKGNSLSKETKKQEHKA